MTITVQTVESVDIWESIANDWQQLLSELPDTTVFYQYQWFQAAWQWLFKQAQLKILVFYQQQQCVAILPLILTQQDYHGLKPRILSFLAVPDTQYADLLVLPSQTQSVLLSLDQYLYQTRQQWDLLELYYLRKNSHLVTLMPRMSNLNHQWYCYHYDNNPWIDLSPSWQEYYKTRTRRLKKGNNLIANKLKRKFTTIEVKHISNINTEADFKELLDMLIDISSQSWKVSTQTTFNYPQPKAFITKLTELALTQQWLSVWVLYLDKQAVALEYQLLGHGEIYGLRADYLASMAEDSVGSYLNWKMLEQLLQQPQFESMKYYMGAGNNPYKTRWQQHLEPIYKINVYSRSIWGQLFLVLAGIKSLKTTFIEKVTALSRKDN